MMKLIRIISCVLLLISISAHAKTVYLTDNLKYTLRSIDDSNGRILRMLPGGTALTLLEVNSETGYSKVRTDSGTEGYVFSRFLIDTPKRHPNQVKNELKKLQKAFALVQQELTQLKTTQHTLATNPTFIQAYSILSKMCKTGSLTNKTTKPRHIPKKDKNGKSNNLTRNEICLALSNTTKLQQQKTQLQKRVIFVERELQQIKRENQTLQNSTEQDWFLYGGILTLIGVVLGFILPNLNWPKRRRWDSL